MSITLSKTGVFPNYNIWTLSTNFWNIEKRYVDAFLKLSIFRNLKLHLLHSLKNKCVVSIVWIIQGNASLWSASLLGVKKDNEDFGLLLVSYIKKMNLLQVFVKDFLKTENLCHCWVPVKLPSFLEHLF